MKKNMESEPDIDPQMKMNLELDFQTIHLVLGTARSSAGECGDVVQGSLLD